MKRLPWLALGLAALGCTQPAAITVTRNFNRPQDVAFVCLDLPALADGRLDFGTILGPTGVTGSNHVQTLPASQCTQAQLDINVTVPNDPMQIPTARRLFAVVSQSDRSEVAVVNLNPRNGDVVLIDNDHTVPGYTFIPVGNLPTRLAVSPDGAITYVTTTGEHSLTLLDNTRLLGGTNYRVHNASGAEVSIALAGPPGDIAITQRPGGPVLLYVNLPTLGAVQVWDVTSPTTTAPALLNTVTLLGGRPTTPMDGGVPDGGAGEGGVDSSITEGGSLDGGMASEGGVDGGGLGPVGGAQPVQLALSPAPATADGVVPMFVSDRAQSIIHVVNTLPAAPWIAETMPLQAGTGTTTITASPVVMDGTATRQFVYAVDVDDQSLLAIDLARGVLERANTMQAIPACQSATFDPNACPKLQPLLPFDRVPVQGHVSSVAFLTRDALQPDCLTPSVPLPTDNFYTTPNPLIFRGVQAVVGLEDGRAQFVDLLDPDFDEQPDRHISSVQVSFQRHLPRTSSAYQLPVSLIANPTLTFNGAGVSGAADLPTIVDPADPSNSAPACSTAATPSVACTIENNYCVSLTPVPCIPGVNQTRCCVGDNYCASTAIPATTTDSPVFFDPVANRSEAWGLTYEGILPGFAQWWGPALAPNTAVDEYTLDAPSGQFCTRGTRQGDSIVIATVSPRDGTDYDQLDAGPRVPPDQSDDPTCTGDFCRDFFGTTQSPCNRELQIVEAQEHTLRVRLRQIAIDNIGTPGYGDVLCPRSLTPDPAVVRRALSCCYPQGTRYEVHAIASWVVIGSTSGYQHNVIRSADDHCVDGPTLPTGRAYTDQTYNGLSFRVHVRGGCIPDPDHANGLLPTPPQRGHAFIWGLQGGYVPFSIQQFLLPRATRYFCTTDRFYILDESQASLYDFSTNLGEQYRLFN